MLTPDIFNKPDLKTALACCCKFYDTKAAVSQGKERISYQELWQEVRQWEEWLHKHLANDLVLVRTSNTIDSLCLMLSGIIAPCIPMFCDPVWKEDEMQKALAINQASFLITEAAMPGNAVLVTERKGFYLYRISGPSGKQTRNNLMQETAFCRFTSGSTGFSRCLQFTQRAFMNAGCNWWQAAKYTAADKIYCLATLNNGLAFNTSLLAAFFSGSELILHHGALVPSIIRKTLEQKQPTVFIAFPFIYEMLVKDEKINAALFKVRLAVSSSAPLSEKAQVVFREKFSIPVCNYYGLAEVGPCTFNNGNLATVGKPLPNVAIAIADNDQVTIKTSSMASAFLDVLDEPFSASINEEGYYISKDTGKLSQENQLVLTGRIGRTINIGGRKIDPAEIEQFIQANNPGHNVVVTAKEMADRKVLVAYVEGKDIRSEEILKLCARHLSPYKIPHQVIVLDAFPRSSTGKLSLGIIQTQNI